MQMAVAVTALAAMVLVVTVLAVTVPAAVISSIQMKAAEILVMMIFIITKKLSADTSNKQLENCSFRFRKAAVFFCQNNSCSMPEAINYIYKETPCTESAGFSNLLHRAFPDFMYYEILWMI